MKKSQDGALRPALALVLGSLIVVSLGVGLGCSKDDKKGTAGAGGKAAQVMSWSRATSAFRLQLIRKDDRVGGVGGGSAHRSTNSFEKCRALATP